MEKSDMALIDNILLYELEDCYSVPVLPLLLLLSQSCLD